MTNRLILEDIRPEDGWILHVETGTFESYSGVQHTLDQFNASRLVGTSPRPGRRPPRESASRHALRQGGALHHLKGATHG